MKFAKSIANLLIAIKCFLQWVRADPKGPASQIVSSMHVKVKRCKLPLNLCIFEDTKDVMLCELGNKEIQ